MTEHVASCAAVEIAPSAAPDAIQLVPLGDIRGRDGRHWRLSNPQAVIANSMRGGIDLPIDYEHQADDPKLQKNGPVPAAGWIKGLEARPDGIWGKVEWTAKASEMIAGKEYRYLSPVFRFDPASGEIMRLTGAGLVHRPNLEMKALAAEEFPMSTQNDDLARIAQALGVADTSADAILTAINSAKTPDPSQYVPVSAVRAMLTERNTQLATLSEQQIDQRVDKAVVEGYITPGMRDWAEALCRHDPDSFNEFVASFPPAFAHMMKSPIDPVKLNRIVEERGRGTYAGSREAQAICSQLGIEPNSLEG